MSFDVPEFRKSFPQLERTMGPRKLVYFDTGASSLKHSKVTDRVNTYNRFETANVHRGAHHTSRQGTEAYEGARKKIQKFVNASDSSEIVFTRGTTEGINFVAEVLRDKINPGDEVVISPLEHHSNIVPWQMLCEKVGAVLKVVPFDKDSGITLEGFRGVLSEKTKVVSLIHFSNSFGNRLPIEEMVKVAKEKGAYTIIDSAQAVVSEKIDVQKIDCDFLVFSSHKMYGPYGVGALYIRKELHEDLTPYQTGGSMIDRVTFDKTTFANAPQKFEAGTPNIAGAIGFGVAADIVNKMNIEETHAHVVQLRNHLINGLKKRPRVQVYEMTADDHCGVVSFNVEGSHPSDVGTLLDKYGFAVRAGHHCTQPLMDLLGIPGTVRVTLAPYNTKEEVDRFLETLEKIEEFF